MPLPLNQNTWKRFVMCLNYFSLHGYYGVCFDSGPWGYNQ